MTLGRSLRWSAALLASLVLATPASGEQLRVALTGGDLVLELPAGWRSKVQRPRPDAPPTIGITTDPSQLQVLVTPMGLGKGGKPPTPDEVRRLVEGGADAAASRSVEKKLKVSELGVAGGSGYYFSATDSAPEPGGYKYLTQGAVGLGELRIVFTILSNGEKNADAARALQVIRTMRRAPP